MGIHYILYMHMTMIFPIVVSLIFYVALVQILEHPKN
jgi:hypothetical protein